MSLLKIVPAKQHAFWARLEDSLAQASFAARSGKKQRTVLAHGNPVCPDGKKAVEEQRAKLSGFSPED